MQEVITKTLIILAAMVAVVLIYNRFGRKKKGCSCVDGDGGTACGDCPQSSCCQAPERPKEEEK